MSSTASGTAVIALWSQLWAGNGPEDRAAMLLAAADASGTYQVRAVKQAYRRAIEHALPAGFQLRANAFQGPAPDPGAAQDRPGADGHPSLLELHRGVLERAVDGPDGDGDAFFWTIAAPYRLDSSGRRLYGTWGSITGDATVRGTVRAALDRWGRDHTDELAASGRYDFTALRRALQGDFGADTALVDRVTAHYRDAIAAVLPTGFTLDGDELRGPHPAVDADARGAVHTVDLAAVIAHCAAAPRELVTAEQAADLIGASSADSTRRTLSRWGVTAVDHRPTAAARLQALFDADQVRDAHRNRPRRGRRPRPR